MLFYSADVHFKHIKFALNRLFANCFGCDNNAIINLRRNEKAMGKKEACGKTQENKQINKIVDEKDVILCVNQ